MERRSFLKQTIGSTSLLATGARAQGAGTQGAGTQSIGTKRDRSTDRIHGCLRTHPKNPRYFTNDGGRAIYLVGSHLGWELQDDAWDQRITFDFDGYLDLLSRHGHNLIRMWCVEHTRTDKSTVDAVATPMPFARTGPGLALDGRPKFDLEHFDETYFQRLRERTIAAGKRGIYVMVMLFQGWSYRVQKKDGKRPWFGNMYNPANNRNGLDGAPAGSPDIAIPHSLGDADLLAIQEAYVRKVVDSVGDLDNVLYEISNESLGSIEWHEHMVSVIHGYEQARVKRHPVVLSGCGDGLTNEQLLACNAEMVGLSGIGDRTYLNDPPAAEGTKIVLHDTDHIRPTCHDPAFVWKNFLRGNHPLVLDWDLVDRKDDVWEPIRRSLGLSRAMAERVNLAAMKPAGHLASTGYCLAESGRAYLVYLPHSGQVQIDLSQSPGPQSAEWIDPRDGKTVQRVELSGGARITLNSPVEGNALVYLQAEN